MSLRHWLLSSSQSKLRSWRGCQTRKMPGPCANVLPPGSVFRLIQGIISEVVRDLRRNGIDALPGLDTTWPRIPSCADFFPPVFILYRMQAMRWWFNAMKADATTSYRSDEWGFNNPRGVLAAGDIDVALVGESYFQGFCLPESQSLPARIREKYPRTANFALAGNRLLGQLGSFREYVEPMRPRVVLWAVNPTLCGDGRRTREIRYSHGISIQPFRSIFWRGSAIIDRLVRDYRDSGTSRSSTGSAKVKSTERARRSASGGPGSCRKPASR